MNEPVFEVVKRKDSNTLTLSIPKRNQTENVSIESLCESISLLVSQNIKLRDGAIEKLQKDLEQLSQILASSLPNDLIPYSDQVSFGFTEQVSEQDTQTYFDLLLSGKHSFTVQGNFLKIDNQKIVHAAQFVKVRIEGFINEVYENSENLIIGHDINNPDRIVKISTGLVASVILFEALQICKKSKKEP